MTSTTRLRRAFALCMISVGLACTAAAKDAPMSYRQFRVVETNGKVTATEPVRPETTPAWARNVSQGRHDWSKGPDMTKPYYKAPIPFVLPPADRGEPFYGHNHCPAITWCPNGDLLAVWFSTEREAGLEMAILASRLRAGATNWESASEFFKAARRNMTGSALLHDGKGTLYHINGMGPENVKHWKKLALLLRASSDNGRTWTAARPISTGGKYTLRHQPIAGAWMTKSGSIIQACDGTWSGEGPTAIHISRDGGKTWTDPGGNIRGIHAGVVELADGRLMAFGRGQGIDGKMPMSISSDMGKIWTHKASPFPPIGGAQRLVFMRLREGPLMLASFSNTLLNHPFAKKFKGAAGVEAHDLNGKLGMVHGPFVALSHDDGKTWSVKRLLSAPKAAGLGNGIHEHFVGRVASNYRAFTLDEQHGEPFGYLAATQTPDGVVHLVSSALYYRFNLAWLNQGGNDMIAKTLIVSEAEKQRLRTLEAKGLVTIKPVALPAGRFRKGDNLHLGWPVGAKVGRTLLCAYHQTLRHHGRGPRQDASSSDAVLVRSTDGGETWSDPVDIRQFGKNDKAMVLNFGNCFGVLGKKVFLATKYGLYRSADEGKTWTLLPDALTQEQTGHKHKDNFGPRMIVHPDRGLIVAVGVERSPCIDMYCSKDEGSTWRHERFQLSDRIHPLEPTVIYHEGHLIFLTRNHMLPFKWHQQIRKTQRPAMMVSETGWFPMRHQDLTNIASYRWPDTTDVDFNPVTKRFEAVVTNRSGGVGENERNERGEQTVNLWSLSKEDMVAGRADKWRFEGTLLRLKSGMLNIGPDDVDAAHPGGAVIDEENGVQHIFIYCGRYSTPAGIYRITRTLDTDKLSSAMHPRRR